jgi:hypothetical protein
MNHAHKVSFLYKNLDRTICLQNFDGNPNHIGFPVYHLFIKYLGIFFGFLENPAFDNMKIPAFPDFPIQIATGQNKSKMPCPERQWRAV